MGFHIHVFTSGFAGLSGGGPRGDLAVPGNGSSAGPQGDGHRHGDGSTAAASAGAGHETVHRQTGRCTR